MSAKPRIAIASYMQESNSFAQKLSVLEDFAVQRATAVCTQHAGTNTEIGGFLDGAAQQDFEPVPLLSAWAVAGGPLELASFDRLCEELCGLVRAARPDGMLLALHGALLLESGQSGDLEVARRVRAALPAEAPLVITMDLHANVLEEMMRQVNGVVAYRTYPHIDMGDTGLRACRLLQKLLAGKRSVNYWISVPLMYPPQPASTSEEPMRSIMGELLRRFSDDADQYASLFCVQPWLDVPVMGSSLVVTDLTGDAGVPRGLEQIAAYWWSRRHDCHVDWQTPETLLDAIAREPKRPVLVSEAFDAPNGGSAGDHTGMLSCLLADPSRFRSCIYMVDPEVPAQLQPEQKVRVTIGAKLNPAYSKPLTLDMDVLSKSNGDFILKGPVFTGMHLSMGPTCVLRVGRTLIVLASRPVLTSDPELFRSQGVEPAEQDVVGIKSPLLFRPAFEAISTTVLHLDMPGPCRGDLPKVPFRNIRRPLFPLDEFDWEPGRS